MPAIQLLQNTNAKQYLLSSFGHQHLSVATVVLRPLRPISLQVAHAHCIPRGVPFGGPVNILKRPIRDPLGMQSRVAYSTYFFGGDQGPMDL